jgi:hypothetical protein
MLLGITLLNILKYIGLYLLACIALPFLFAIWMMVSLYLAPKPPRPRITFARFPIRLEYEINEERVVFIDTLQCMYDGIGGRGSAQGMYHKWKWELASGNKRLTLLKIDNDREICYPLGNVEYYMGYGWSEPVFYGVDLFDWKIGGRSTIFVDELLTNYHIKIIKWDKIEPVQQQAAEKR